MNGSDMSGLLNSSIQEACNFFIASGACIESFSRGTVVYRCGERLSKVYFILSGRVNIQISTESGAFISYRQMEGGGFFGELSVLRKEPSTADAVVLDETKVLCCPAEIFHKGIEESPDIRALLIANLAGSVSETRQEVWNFYQNADAFELFLYPDKKSGPVIAKSAAAKNLLDSINGQAAAHEPLLLLGERGSGKFFFANHIHGLWSRQFERTAGRRQSPFVSFDFSKFGDHSLNFLLRNLSKYGLRLAEFNLDEHVLRPTESGTLILRRIDSLNLVSQEAVLRLVRLIEENNQRPEPKIRLITTAAEDIRNRVREGRFLKPLCDILSRHVISIPPLRERKADVLPLARHFLAQADPARTAGFSHSAEQRLTSLTMSRENVVGLRKTVDFAVLLSGGDAIAADQIVNDPNEESLLFQYDVGISRWCQYIASPPRLVFIRNSVVIIFLLVIWAGLLTGNGHAANFANNLVWWFFLPMAFFFFFFLGRLFCSVCPVAGIAELFQRCLGMSLPVPEYLKNRGIHVSAILFISIITAEHMFNMSSAPLATGWLFITLIALASFLGFLYERRVWCRYLCPLGTLAACFGVGSTLHMRANSSICSEVCKEHVCVNDTGEGGGCPVFQHPLNASSNNFCVHCFRCMNICPHKSSRYLAHPPLQNIWGMGSITHALTPFSLFIFIYSLTILWMETHRAMTARYEQLFALAVGSLLLSAALSRLMDRLFREEVENDSSHVARIGFSFLITAWGGLIAYMLPRIPFFADIYIDSLEGSFVRKYLFDVHTPLYVPFQIFFLLGGALLALFALSQIRDRLKQQGVSLSSAGWRVVFIVVLAHAAASMAIVLS